MIYWENNSFEASLLKVPIVSGFLEQKPDFDNSPLNILKHMRHKANV